MSTPQQSLARAYSQGFGTTGINTVHKDVRAPGTQDIQYPVGQIWVNTIGNTSYILTSFSASAGVTTANWQELTNSGGAGPGAFTTLTSSGNTTLATGAGTVNTFGNTSGATSLTLSVGTGNFLLQGAATSTMTIGTGLTTGTISIGGSAQTGTITIGNSSGTNAVQIGVGAGAATITIGNAPSAPSIVNIGGTTTTSATTLFAGSGNINLTATNVIQAKSLAASAITNQVTNSDNTSGSSNASYQVAVGGASSGDPYIDFLVSGAGHYALGIDNSVSDNFVLAASGTLGTSNIASWTSAGALTNAAGITATTGNITATAGNLVTVAAASGVVFPVTLGSGAASGTVNCNGRVGSVTFTSPSIAAGATQSLVVGNTSVTGSGTVVLYFMRGATTSAAIGVQSVTNGAGTSTIVVTNGTGATTQTGDLTFDFIVLN